MLPFTFYTVSQLVWKQGCICACTSVYLGSLDEGNMSLSLLWSSWNSSNVLWTSSASCWPSRSTFTTKAWKHTHTQIYFLIHFLTNFLNHFLTDFLLLDSASCVWCLDSRSLCWGWRCGCVCRWRGSWWGRHSWPCERGGRMTARADRPTRRTSSEPGCGWRSWVWWRRCPDWTRSACRVKQNGSFYQVTFLIVVLLS